MGGGVGNAPDGNERYIKRIANMSDACGFHVHA